MPIKDLYIHREQATNRKNVPDVYEYNFMSTELINQLFVVFEESLGGDRGYSLLDGSYIKNPYWEQVIADVYRGTGLSVVLPRTGFGGEVETNIAALYRVCCSEPIILKLTVIELLCQAILAFDTKNLKSDVRPGTAIWPAQKADAIAEINVMFSREGVGYCFEGGQIIKISSRLLHDNVVLPCLTIVSDAELSIVNEHYREAFKHFKDGNLRPAIMSASHALEAMLNAICIRHGFEVNEKPTFRHFYDVLKRNNFLPAGFNSVFETLKSCGVAKIRNATTGHAAGVGSDFLDNQLVEYALHLAGSDIVFLERHSRNLLSKRR